MNGRSQRLLVSAVPASFGAAALSAPAFSALSLPLVAWAIWQFFSSVCHQDPARSFWILGAPVAVCARCLGIYLGAAVGAWIPAPRRVLLAGLALFAALNLADVLTETAALHGNWMVVRFLLGALMGMAAASLVANSLRQETPARLRSELL